MDNLGGVQAAQPKAWTNASVIDLRDASASADVWGGPEDPAPKRQVRVPTLLSFAGDLAATLAAVGLIAALLPWAPQPTLPQQALIAAVCLFSFALSGLYNRPRLAELSTEMLAVVRGV